MPSQGPRGAGAALQVSIREDGLMFAVSSQADGRGGGEVGVGISRSDLAPQVDS